MSTMSTSSIDRRENINDEKLPEKKEPTFVPFEISQEFNLLQELLNPHIKDEKINFGTISLEDLALSDQYYDLLSFPEQILFKLSKLCFI